MSKYYNKSNLLLLSMLLLTPIAFVMAAPPDSIGTATNLEHFEKKKSHPLLFNNASTPGKLEDRELADPSGLFNKFLSGLHAGGFYRGYFWGRTMNNAYDGLAANKTLTMGDGYFDPVMLMYVGGAPTPTTSLGTELILANPFEAYRGPGVAPERTFNTFFNTVLRGTINTKFGNYNVLAGGIEWTQLSPFTFGSNVGYQRYSLWERRPWDPGGNVNTRYASYYYNGTINQDARFGTRAFKGFIVNGFNMPYNLSLNFFYGKTDVNGGFDREAIVRPKSNIGGKITKTFKNNNRISLNNFNSFVRSDSINSKVDVQWNIITTEFDFKFKGFNLNGEVGLGGYESPTYKRSWGEGVILNLVTPKNYTLLPFNLRFFQIDKSFTSNVSQFSNTSIQEVTSGFLSANTFALVPFGGNMSGVGDLNNNRRGGAINTEIKIWKLKFSIGTQMESEMDRTRNANILTYGHRINGLAWSRLPGYFPVPVGIGPNGRVNTFYRGSYETVNVSENNADSTALFKKHYNALDFQVKFKGKLFNKDIYFYNLNTVMSAQNKFSALPVFGEKAYINARYHEAEVYYQLNRELVVSVYGGIERIVGNKFTDTTNALNGVQGITGKARDQLGKSFGLGADISLSNQTSLYLRHRWFSYADKYFLDEDFVGQETTIELKIFF